MTGTRGLPQDVPDAIEEIGELLEIRGKEKDAFRIRAYKRAAQALRDHVSEIEDRVKAGTLQELPGIGEALAEKVEEFLKTGKITAYEDLKKKMPEGLLQLLQIPSLGPKKVKLLYQRLRIKSIKDLKRAIASGKLLGLPGIQERMVEKIQEGIALIEGIGERKLLAEIRLTVEAVLTELKKCKTITKLEIGGSYRRREETIGDIDILVIAKNREDVAACIRTLPNLEKIIAEGKEKISFLLKGGLQVDIRMIGEASWGAALQYFTGSKAHNVELRSFAKSKGMKVSEYGVFRVRAFRDAPPHVMLRRPERKRGPSRSISSRGGAPQGDVWVAGRIEEEVYKALGMDYIAPELRQGSGEIAAALARKLPKLVTAKDIKGDLHVHSLWSDGQDSIEAIARAADALGYEYIAISDHSPSLRIAAGPKTKADILKKQAEIERVQQEVKVRLLCGTEVDIKMDGNLDYEDDLLRLFDVVIAAIHSGFTGDATERLLKACEHPLVHAIAHPTGRLLGMRSGYPLDTDALIAKVKETGTWLEINGQGQRLDLPFTLVRKAKEADVRFIVSTDAHSASSLQSLMDLGISVARRGWLEKKDVANALSLKEFFKALRKER